jgi:hypothetical protein
VLLKPVAVVERERAWQRIQEITSRVRDLRPDPRKSNEEEEEEIASIARNDVGLMRQGVRLEPLRRESAGLA